MRCSNSVYAYVRTRGQHVKTSFVSVKHGGYQFINVLFLAINWLKYACVCVCVCVCGSMVRCVRLSGWSILTIVSSTLGYLFLGRL